MAGAFPLNTWLGYMPHPTSYMWITLAVELAGGLCMMMGRTPTTRRRGSAMLVPISLLAAHAFFPDQVRIGNHRRGTNEPGTRLPPQDKILGRAAKS